MAVKPGARLPSWRDLAVQLGVARGTIREAYERLTDDQLITASGPAGTHVSDHLPAKAQAPDVAIAASLADAVAASRSRPLPFQIGIPAQDAFPAKLWGRIRMRTAPAETLSLTYPDPRGLRALREQIAAYLAIARGIRCAPEQVLVTSGYRNGLDPRDSYPPRRGRRGMDGRSRASPSRDGGFRLREFVRSRSRWTTRG